MLAKTKRKQMVSLSFAFFRQLGTVFIIFLTCKSAKSYYSYDKKANTLKMLKSVGNNE